MKMTLRDPFPSALRIRGACGQAVTAALTLTAWLVLTPPAFAFHDGGVGSCARCHVMHLSSPGQVALDGDRPLLLAASSTDLCLTCHGDGGVMGTNPLLPPRELGAGNFVFLLEDDLGDAPGPWAPRLRGESAGHSIVSPARGLAADSRWSRAPGGTFPSASLGCTSCHDPHGSAGFRMLHGAGPVQGGLAVFVHPAPVGAGLPLTDPSAGEAPASHTAYIAGMTRWCANCHGYYHDRDAAPFQHPVDTVLDTGLRRRYERYAGDADPTGGDAATSYLPEVPFEAPDAAVDATAGPGSSGRLHCLTCHRAHASSAPAAGRWDFNVYRLADDGVASGSWPLPSPYPDPDQRQLCRKCHTLDHDQGNACLTCHRRGDPDVHPHEP
jgi:predicted CXXCH cytochrome family protein